MSSIATSPLPIDPLLPQICQTLRGTSALIVRAMPGAGKTTRVPPALWQSGVCGDQQILVLQPRRLAARSTAQRMADEHGSRLGDQIGYQVRFDSRISSRTRIIVLTEGTFLRRVLDDPFLEHVGAIVIDEFHERHLETDLALAMTRRIQTAVRDDLKLVVMSATLSTTQLQAYLPEARVIECDVRSYPVDVRYLPPMVDESIVEITTRGVKHLAREIAGDLLVFLPGVGEIRQTQQRLRETAEAHEWDVLPLYGELSSTEQDRVFRPSERRRIILSTNLAETSLTIPGITGVVDSGWARRLEYDPSTGLNQLSLRPISQASAEQRAGRAGRLQAGVCLRLWNEAAQRVKQAFDPPEIERIDLSGTVLSLKTWGETDLATFPWFEAPPAANLTQADKVLQLVGATDHAGRVTPLGQQIAGWPLSPRLGRLLHEAAVHGEAARGAWLCALLSERDPFLSSGRRERARHQSSSDVLDRVDALLECRRTGRSDTAFGPVAMEGLRRLEQVAERLERLVSRLPTVSTSWSLEERLARAVLAAFPDRLVRRREGNLRQGVMVGGRGVRLRDESAVTQDELYVAVRIDGGAEEAQVSWASGVLREWLPVEHLTTQVVVEFDETSGRVQARRQTRWLDLLLDESPTSLPAGEAVAKVLIPEARRHWERVFPPEDEGAMQYLARVRCLREWMPALNLPDWNDRALQELLPELAGGCRSLADLRKAPWRMVLQQQLTSLQQQAVDRDAPERITVPSGSRLAITYAHGSAPVLAVRIQEIFGWTDTPRIAGGRVKLLLHLLAPNSRPQQVTDDLRSFWTTAYFQIRGELRRRYPKHSWPEDPLNAEATRRPSGPRRGPLS